MVYLASASPTRFQLLHRAGVAVLRAKTDFDETVYQKAIVALPPIDQALFLARGKARSAINVPPSAMVIGADQTASIDGEVFHKAATLEMARQQLLLLRGKTHILTSAVSCHLDGNEVFTHIATAELTMRNFSDEYLEDYLRSAGDDLCNTVGCYRIEERGLQLFSVVAGDHNTILGLPLLPLLEFLRSAGEIPS